MNHIGGPLTEDKKAAIREVVDLLVRVRDTKEFRLTEPALGYTDVAIACDHYFGGTPEEFPPIDRVGSFQLQVCLKAYDGYWLFHCVEPWNVAEAHHMRLFSLEEIEAERIFLRTLLEASHSRWSDDFAELQRSSSIDLLRWYDGLVPVARAYGSADVIVLDTSAAGDEEPHLVQFDHEYLFASPIDDGDVPVLNRWHDFVSFLDALADDPPALIW